MRLKMSWLVVFIVLLLASVKNSYTTLKMKKQNAQVIKSKTHSKKQCQNTKNESSKPKKEYKKE